jgi:hypothetical protein
MAFQATFSVPQAGRAAPSLAQSRGVSASLAAARPKQIVGSHLKRHRRLPAIEGLFLPECHPDMNLGLDSMSRHKIYVIF